MHIESIKGDDVYILFHPVTDPLSVGSQFSITELAGPGNGIVVQIISTDSVEYPGIQQELIQEILEKKMSSSERVIDRETGMNEIRSLKLAKGKIRKRIVEGRWIQWDGWIPTRNVKIQLLSSKELLSNIMPQPKLPINSFARMDGEQISIDGPRLNMVNVIAGVKGSGKSHLAKHLILSISSKKVPCIVFDVNGEYLQLPNAQILDWGNNFFPSLAELGHETLSDVINSLRPLPENSKSVLDLRLPNIFSQRKEYLEKKSQPFEVFISDFVSTTFDNNNYVQDAIVGRLNAIDRKNLFKSSKTPSNSKSFKDMYSEAANDKPIVFDLRQHNNAMQKAFVKAINMAIERICKDEKTTGRYPFIFYEEAHYYIMPDAILSLITRGRHIGLASVFVTNTPQSLPDMIFRQLDNLFLLSLSHKDDIRNVSKNSFTDEDTIESFVTRMPRNHALFVGNITDRFPLIVSIDDLPNGIGASGKTKSAWDRLLN